MIAGDHCKSGCIVDLRLELPTGRDIHIEVFVRSRRVGERADHVRRDERGVVAESVIAPTHLSGEELRWKSAAADGRQCAVELRWRCGRSSRRREILTLHWKGCA